MVEDGGDDMTLVLWLSSLMWDEIYGRVRIFLWC